jgi:RNA polymerase sigma factor (sigma-70 family)
MSGAMEEFELTFAAAKRGDGQAFARLYEWLAAPVHGYLRSRRVADAEGMTNDVFLRAFKNVSSFSGDGEHFRSWVFTIAHNATLDERRRAARRPADIGLAVVPEQPTSDAADDALETLARERIERLLGRLAPDQRDVFLLRVLGDLSVAQTAEVLGKSYEAVKALQRRGAASLKKLLADEGVPK